MELKPKFSHKLDVSARGQKYQGDARKCKAPGKVALPGLEMTVLSQMTKIVRHWYSLLSEIEWLFSAM